MPFRAADEGTRRKVVYPDDLLKYYKVWDNKIKKVFGTITKLQQPLRTILNEGLWEKIEDITSGKEEMESILANFYNGNHMEHSKYPTKTKKDTQLSAFLFYFKKMNSAHIRTFI